MYQIQQLPLVHRTVLKKWRLPRNADCKEQKKEIFNSDTLSVRPQVKIEIAIVHL